MDWREQFKQKVEQGIEGRDEMKDVRKDCEMVGNKEKEWVRWRDSG